MKETHYNFIVIAAAFMAHALNRNPWSSKLIVLPPGSKLLGDPQNPVGSFELRVMLFISLKSSLFSRAFLEVLLLV
jgi:hypothetical protein